MIKITLTLKYIFSGNHHSGLIREVWKGLRGYQVVDLTSNLNFPNNPTSVEVIDNFDAPFNVDDNYGARVQGYFVAPETGSYRYGISKINSQILFMTTYKFILYFFVEVLSVCRQHW